MSNQLNREIQRARVDNEQVFRILCEYRQGLNCTIQQLDQWMRLCIAPVLENSDVPTASKIRALNTLLAIKTFVTEITEEESEQC